VLELLLPLLLSAYAQCDAYDYDSTAVRLLIEGYKGHSEVATTH